ncbi:MAG: YHS domain-containing protein [Bryobacteraceae bacterium]|nr:YHS domain-containing protein [Bryobacteraceae bacterium]
MTRNLSHAMLGLALATILFSWAGNALAQSGAAQKKQQQAPAKVIDPVCNMQIDPAKAAAKSEYKGQTIYFCSDHCKRKFDAAPETYLRKTPPKK